MVREVVAGRLETSTMQTHGSSASAAGTSRDQRSRLGATQKVLIVNGNSEALEVLEPVLDAGNYDVVFVESSEHAYSQIKRVRPDLVVLCVAMDEPDGFNVLSMLKLDEDTRDIQVITCAATGAEVPADDAEESESLAFPTGPALRMN
jgi:PleD family two-component response regulator